ncbi:MAG TPA: iron ABC transporter permease [Gammaproteobacteria bacterium]|nr:iron ABC transporter permease [Gammaproteobacteria bacterium]
MNAARPALLLPALLALLLAALAAALLSGSVTIDPARLWQPDSTAGRILWELRLPRAATAFTSGALLALAGVLMQVLLRNPLADPYILGVSGGASVGALLALMAGAGRLLLQGAAFAGALLSTLLVFTLAHGRGSWNPGRLLLTGVVLAAGWGALISLLLSLGPDTGLRGMLFWLMGDLGQARWPWWGLLVLAAGLALALAQSRALNLLAGGDEQAAALGVNSARLRGLIYLLASLLTASAVTLAGNIGFVGLVVPHLLRLLGARDHRLLLPASVLAGGTLLVLADTLARTALAPRQLPVGVLTALLGVPLFLLLLHRNREIRLRG